ncbi:2'-5' RNA ligase family protein [Streptomyces platensis]|uniref:2'-5' RNA ligase family protein n=1 Tax=Streptomyces platensis TaxID=58346 RepID=UPI0038656CB8
MSGPALADLLGKYRAFDLRFERCGWFPGVLYLASEPDTQLRRLTEVVAERWPEAPPYDGAKWRERASFALYE